MGKIPTPRKGLRNTRASPLDAGDPVVENGENEDPFSGHEVGEMKNQIMNNLFSTKATDRERGALLFANLLQTNKDAVDAWFEKCSDVAAVKKSHLGDITRTLAPLLLDPKPSVRVAVAEALSRLSSISDLFAEVMVELDVMTPLQGCFERYFGDTSWLEKSIKFESQIYSYLCDILANLCARCPKALRKFNATSLSILLAKTLGCHDNHVEAAIPSAETLCTVVEDNPITALQDKEFMAVLVKILADVDNSVEPQKMLLASYSGHLLCNLMSSLNENEQLSALRLVLNHVSNCLRFAVTPDLLTLADDISKFDENGSGEDASDKIALTSKLLNTSLTAKRVALETLANLCSENDWDDAEGMEFEEDDSEPDEDLKDVAEGIEDSIGFSHPETESMIVQLNLLGDAINHLEPPNEEMKTELSKLSYGREVLDNVFSIQSNALVAIGNLVQSLDKEHLSDSSLLTQRLMALIQSEISKKVQVLIAEAISVTRSLVTTGILTVPSTDVPMFCQLVTTSSDPLLRISCIKILGIIGSKSEVCDEVEAITSFLLEICESGNQSASLDVRSEAIDNVMDMHSEDTKTDSIVIKLNLLRRLEAINKAMRAELKADKRKTKRKNPIIETVLLNLTRFIKYKISMVGK